MKKRTKKVSKKTKKEVKNFKKIKKVQKVNKLKVFVFSLLIVYLTAFIGSFFTSMNTGSQWYQEIKPSITPPNYVFPIVWNILFFLIAVSLYFAWINSDKKQKMKVMIVFGINFVLNILWSVFYFGMQKPNYAFFELIFLWLSIIAMIFVTARISKKSAWLLVPYLLWVSFAGVLNYMSAF
jgi:tryptophan-rich sensory protein